MADNDEKIVYKLDLDADAFMKVLGEVNQKLGNLEKSAKVTEVASWLTLAKTAAEGFKIAVELAGKALDVVFDGEKLLAVERQFENLASSAGLVADELKRGLMSASGGLLGDDDLMQAANKSLVTMGENAGKLPEIMAAAKKATSAFGGDLAQNFDTFSQAIGTGNARMLKQFGIVVDSEKAIRDYAKAVGTTVSGLTELERKQAVGNAALAQAKVKYKDIQGGLKPATEAWKQMQVAIHDVQEAVSMLFAKAFGPFFTAAFKAASFELKAFTANLKATFSDDPIVKSEALAVKISTISKRLEDMKASGRDVYDKQSYDALSQSLEKAKAQYEGLKGAKEAAEAKKEASAPEAAAKEDGSGNDKRLAAQTKFETDLLNMRKSTVEGRLQIESDSIEQEKLIQEQYDLAYQQKELNKLAIDQQLKSGEIASYEQAEAMKLQIAQQYDSQIQELRFSAEQKRLLAYQNEVRAAQDTSSGIAAAFKQGSAQASADMNNFGAQGQRVYRNLTSHAVTAFKEMGAGQKSAGDIAKRFLFGMLADEAEARGEFMLLSSIWPPNPLGLAGGAALLALGGFLRSQSGGGGSSAPSSSVGGSIGGEGPVSGTASPNANQFEQNKKAVTIQVQGSYFETEQTKQRLLEMIRDQTDATDFKYQQIGGN